MRTAAQLFEEINNVELTHQEVIERLREFQSEAISSFVSWHNDNYPENYIPNSRIGKFNLSINEIQGIHKFRF